MFNYSSPSVKNSALLALASIPHKLAGSLIFGIWCRAVLLFLPSSVGLLALPRSRVIHTGVHTRVQSQWCTVSVSFVRQPAPLCCWGFAHNVFATGFKVFSKSTTAAISSWRLQHAFHSAKLHNCSHSIALQTEAENARLLRSPNCAFQ